MKKTKQLQRPIRQVTLTKEEIDDLKKFADENLASGCVEIVQTHTGGIGNTTRVQVKDLPETLTDITDIDSW